MKNIITVCIALLLPIFAVAQSALPSAVPLSQEDLTAPRISPSTPVVKPALAANSMQVQTTLTMAGSVGFDRDAALEKAARKALPEMLGRLTPPMEASKAAETAAKIGDPMQFVSSFNIVKETLVPHYTLTVLFTFNQAKLESNFGRKVVTPNAVSLGKPATTSSTQAPAAQQAQGQAYVLRAENASPAQHYKMLQAAKKLDAGAMFSSLSLHTTRLTFITTKTPEQIISTLASAGVHAGAVVEAEGEQVFDVSF
jgi:hypothetical protein